MGNIAKCIVCKKDRPQVAVTHNDPFCSATCAREFYGTQLPASNPKLATKPAGMKQRPIMGTKGVAKWSRK